MRACEPTRSGKVVVDGVEIGFEVFGDGPPKILLMPTSCIVHARIWKMQIPYLARHYGVVTFDGPGNGMSSNPEESAAYTPEAHVRYTLAVLDAVGAGPLPVLAVSGGTHRTLRLAAEHPDRVTSLVLFGSFSPLGGPLNQEVVSRMLAGDQEPFLEVFMAAAFTEPHSTKALEDGMGWGRETTIPIFARWVMADQPADIGEFRAMCARVACPVLVIHGTADALTPVAHGIELAKAIGENARLVMMEGAGHRPDMRDPVHFARMVREFLDPPKPKLTQSRTWTRAAQRKRRALYLSSPIGLGHARRDVAIARELRALRPDLEIDWLAGDPVTRVLAHEKERIHPASRYLANESAHMESESAGHDLHCFQAWRRMDEILVANFMVLHDVLEEERYDLIVADEAWEADHFFHENPELKRGAFAWLTDFIGWLPMPEGGDREAALTTDYNAEMIEQVARYPWVRDRAIFVGNPDDVVPMTFGAGLPDIRSWAERNFAFPGYVTGFAPAAEDRAELRRELGFRPDDLVCIATVGGSSVGTTLLKAVVDAFPLAKAKRPELRMRVVAGPRIDARAVAQDRDGLEVVGFVPDLYRHLAACDLAIVQGGLTTAMELTAASRPFLYFPLARHFEQQIHVPHRLGRYGAGRRMDYATTDRERLASAIVEEVGREVCYRPVETDGAARAARIVAELL